MAYIHEEIAIRVLDLLHRAEDSIVGREVVLFSGETGIVREVSLHDVHGLCFTMKDPLHPFDVMEGGASREWKPVSLIKEVVYQ